MDKTDGILHMSEDVTNTIAVVVGIETYRILKNTSVIDGVKFAMNDALMISQTLKHQFKINDDNIFIVTNENATLSYFKNELSYLIQGLTETDRFIFYYAGHGFYKDGFNRLTSWDTSPINLADTTVCLNEVIYTNLRKSRCSQVLLFIDACAIHLPGETTGRDLISSLNKEEFQQFIESRNYQALFMSCSPGEKSYPSTTLGHGVWTWNLLQALNGKQQEALNLSEWLTDVSLKNYLSNSVVSYMKGRSEFPTAQNPFSSVNASNEFCILRFPLESVFKSLYFEFEFNKLRFRKVRSIPFNKLPGFSKQKGHFVPDNHHILSSIFGRNLLKDTVNEEVDATIDGVKKILDLKRRDFEKINDAGNVKFINSYFSVEWETIQDRDSPGEMSIITQVILHSDMRVLNPDVDGALPEGRYELVLPIICAHEYDEVANYFESLAASLDGEFSEDEDSYQISITLNNGCHLCVSLGDDEFIFSCHSIKGCISLWRYFMENIINVLNINLGPGLVSSEG